VKSDLPAPYRVDLQYLLRPAKLREVGSQKLFSGEESGEEYGNHRGIEFHIFVKNQSLASPVLPLITLLSGFDSHPAHQAWLGFAGLNDSGRFAERAVVLRSKFLGRPFG
jgi:hypothetical protein